MKKSIFTLSFLTLVAATGFGQQGTQVSPMRIYRMETTTAAPAEKTELTKEEEIKQCKDLLAALDTKEAWLRANPEELKKAEEAGWFVDAEATRARLNARLKELEGN